jgi:hypothetical protein
MACRLDDVQLKIWKGAEKGMKTSEKLSALSGLCGKMTS